MAPISRDMLYEACPRSHIDRDAVSVLPWHQHQERSTVFFSGTSIKSDVMSPIQFHQEQKNTQCESFSGTHVKSDRLCVVQRHQHQERPTATYSVTLSPKDTQRENFRGTRIERQGSLNPSVVLTSRDTQCQSISGTHINRHAV